MFDLINKEVRHSTVTIHFRLTRVKKAGEKKMITAFCTDPYEDHVFSCRSNVRMNIRPNEVRDEIFRCVERAGKTPRLEELALLEQTQKRPADIRVLSWKPGVTGGSTPRW